MQRYYNYFHIKKYFMYNFFEKVFLKSNGHIYI